MARTHGHLKPGAVFHSGRGAQYTSKEFSYYCRKIRVTTSLGGTGVCWDNAAAESFFASLKNECYHRHRHATHARARFAVAYSSRSSTTANGYTAASATAPPPRPYTTTSSPQQQPNQEKPEELSKIVDTAHFGHWGETFSDDVVAAAMIDRLVHHAEVLTLSGDSYRTRVRRELLAKDRDN